MTHSVNILIFRVFLGLLLLSTLTRLTVVQGQDSPTYSGELDQTSYSWELTKLELLEDVIIDIQQGDTWKIEFSEAPGGLDIMEYGELDITLSVNDEVLGQGTWLDLIMVDFESLSQQGLIAYNLILLEWAQTNPDELFNEENGFEVNGDLAVDTRDADISSTYDKSSGLLLKNMANDGSFVFDYKNSNSDDDSSSLPWNPFFSLIALIAIPYIKKSKHRSV